MRAIFTFTVWAVLLAAVPLAMADDQKGDDLKSISWGGYNEGLAMGREFNRPVFIHFTARWCKWCVKMQNETYSDPRVISYMADHFAAVKIDTEQNPTLARKYNVESVPTLWFLDSSGKGLTSINGFVGPDKFLLVLEYIATEAYEELDYQTWARRHSSD